MLRIPRPGGSSTARTTGLATTATAVVALVWATASAGIAEEYPPDGSTVSMESLTLTSGDTTTISGQGWLPGSTVTISILSDHEILGRTEVAADGSFSTEVTIPTDLAPGEHVLRVEGTDADGEPTRVETTFTVAAPDDQPGRDADSPDEDSPGEEPPADSPGEEPSPGEDGDLAATGAGLLGALASVAVLLAVGWALVRFARQRRRRGEA